jgi:hypothetical protein
VPIRKIKQLLATGLAGNGEQAQRSIVKIDPRIQKQIDNLPDNVMILISDEESLGVKISYESAEGSRFSPLFGEVEIENMGGGPCSDAWKVMYASAEKGWGPLLYEVAIEWTSQNGGGLTSDRRSAQRKQQQSGINI